MSRKLQLILIACIVTVLASATSHFLVVWLKIETSFGQEVQEGSAEGKTLGFRAGSSLAAAISWDRVATQLDQKLVGWGVAGSSPWEWEPFQRRLPEAKVSFFVISAYDLNEYFLCDFHANVVPLNNSFSDLWRSPVDWHFSKRVLSQYPLKYVRALFPTVGRSQGVMSGLRDKLRGILGRSKTDADRPTLGLAKNAIDEEYRKERLSSWSPARTLRRLALMRQACQGRHGFNGPKQLAFLRMLQQAEKQGSTLVVVVVPVSPVYAREFLSPEISRQFEKALAEAQQKAPQAIWARLDQLPALNSNEYFFDSVHINLYGQQIATDALLSKLKSLRASL